MVDKKSSWLLTLAACAIASHAVAQQPPSPHEQSVSELARQQRELARQEAALHRDYARQQADFVRERAAMQRELASERSRMKALSAAENVKLQQQLGQAREQLARAVGDVARASAQLTQPAQYRVRRTPFVFTGSQAVLGLNIEDSDFGVFVTGVTPNGPAATAGVTVGDTIVSINDVELARLAGTTSPTAALLGQIGNVAPGDDVKLRILRGGDYRDVVVKAGEGSLRQPFLFTGDWPMPYSSWLRGVRQNSRDGWAAFLGNGLWSDIELVTLTPALGEYFGVTKGLLVVRAGRAAELGFRDGDVIIDIAGREPQSPEHALRILASFEPGESLQAAVMRQRKRESLAIRVPTASAD